MEITVLFFGMLTDITSTSSLILNEVESTEDVTKKLFNQFPSLSNKVFRLAVNEQLISTTIYLKDGDKVALLPPFSGG